MNDLISKVFSTFSFSSLTSMAAYGAVMLISVLLAFKLGETVATGGPPSTRSGWTNLFSLIIGIVAGWTLGVFWVPFNTVDAKAYQQIGAAVSTFASGYLLSKFDRVFELLLYDDADKKHPSRTTMRRACFFAVGMLATGMVVTSTRLAWLEVASRCDPLAFDKESKRAPHKPSCDEAGMPFPDERPVSSPAAPSQPAG